MAKACGSCGRPAVMKSPRCAYCGGALVDGAPAAAAAAEAAGQVAPSGPATARPAAPPVAAKPPAGTAAVPFPAARPATQPSRPSAAPAVPDEPVPPLWQQILEIPFATRGRRIALALVAFVALAIYGMNRVIEGSRPKENVHGFALEPASPGGRLVAVPPGPGAMPIDPGAEPQPARPPSFGIDQALEQLAQALTAYADENRGFPGTLSADLGELRRYGDMERIRGVLAGGELTQYQIQVDRNGRQTLKVVVQARDNPRMLSRSLYYPPASTGR